MNDPLAFCVIGFGNVIPAEQAIKRIAAVFQNAIIRIRLPAQGAQHGGLFTAIQNPLAPVIEGQDAAVGGRGIQ